MDSRTTESRISEARDSVVVEIHDTLTITITKTITENEAGDTIKVVQVTDRERMRDRTGFRVQDSRVTVKRDTVYVERKDSVRVQDSGFRVQGTNRASPVVSSLKWIFWIIIALIALVITLTVTLTITKRIKNFLRPTE